MKKVGGKGTIQLPNGIKAVVKLSVEVDDRTLYYSEMMGVGTEEIMNTLGQTYQELADQIGIGEN